MANENQSVRTCILKVDIKCCTGCQKKASKKLQSLPGVTAAEYNAEKGLMTVTGDVEPMSLVRKLTKCGKKTELVSVTFNVEDVASDEEDDTSSSSSSPDTSNPDTRPKELETQVKTTTMVKKKEGILSKYLLLGCLKSEPKAFQPLVIRNPNTQVPSNFENRLPGRNGFPQMQPWYQSKMMQQQPQYMMMQQQQQQQPLPQNMMMQQQQQPQNLMMQQQFRPQYPMGGAPMMPQGAVLQQRPYFMKGQTTANPSMTVNKQLHYPG